LSIGIITAIETEMIAIKNKMKNIKEKNIYNLCFYNGEISNKDCILVQCGVGKVNSARTTQILIDNFNVDIIINVGSAGGISSNLNVEDIVIGDKLVQYDFDATSFGYEKGEICKTGKYFYSDKNLIELCKQTIEEYKNEKINIVIGTIGTADLFCASPEKAAQIEKEFDALCVEMEGAAIAQVATLDNIPFLVIRAISDTPNGKNKIDFDTFINIVSKRVAEILEKLLYKI